MEQTNRSDETIRKMAADLLLNHKEYEGMIISNYGRKVIQMVYGGSIDFDPEGLNTVVNGEKLTYNDYIDAQINAIGKTHSGFQWCFYNIPLGFKGQVEKASNGHICFQRIYIEGMYFDGQCSEYKEQHVWMDLAGFENALPGDCFSFFAEPYRYLKTGNGKQIDYGLRNPESIVKIDRYELPTDDEIMDQELETMLCETCFLSESCDRMICTNQQWRETTKKSMKALLKKSNNM